MSLVSKVSCGLIAAMYLVIGFSHLKDPEASLRDFGVKGDISPIAKHCCAVIGCAQFPTAAAMLYAITAPAAVRKALVLCFTTTIIPCVLVQFWYPFNNPPPAFPMEMPFPIIGLQVVLAIVAIFGNNDDAKPKKK